VQKIHKNHVGGKTIHLGQRKIT